MALIGRNAICPCGSGKKYKKCCLAQEEAKVKGKQDEQSAIRTSLDWLYDRYPDEVGEAIHIDFMGERDEAELEVLDNLPSHLAQAVFINIGEWLLNEAELSINGKDCRAIDLLFGPKGPRLSASGRAWLTEVGKRSMSLYEVCEVKKGVGLLLKDLVHSDQAPVWVHDKAASGCVLQWDIFGARLACKGGDMVMTGAVYPLDREQAHACLDEIEEGFAWEEDDPLLMRKTIAWCIIDFWLESLLEKKPMPRLVDASSGEKIDFTTDLYRVLDWKRLEQALAEQENVDGDRAEGWNRFVESGDGRCRSLATIIATKNKVLQVECRTIKMADETRVWLEKVAGDAVVHSIRDIVDPRSSQVVPSAQKDQSSDIPQEMQWQIIHEYLLKHYESWTEIPLSALGGKSPMQAVKTKKGREAVVDLLKSIEQLEQRRTMGTGGEPLDVRFLWERLCIKRETL